MSNDSAVTSPRAARRLLSATAVLVSLAAGCGAVSPTSPPAGPGGTTVASPSVPLAGTGGAGEPDGRLPDGATVRDEELPGIAGLEPDLAAALRRATTDAAEDSIEVRVSSGWRSTGYQTDLLEDAVTTYGSREEAARWVATPETSPHVSGDAVDIAPYDAIDWLARHGDRYGLCQIYGNESWHYEYRPDAVEDGCPPMYEDPTQDPRMQQVPLG